MKNFVSIIAPPVRFKRLLVIIFLLNTKLILSQSTSILAGSVELFMETVDPDTTLRPISYTMTPLSPRWDRANTSLNFWLTTGFGFSTHIDSTANLDGWDAPFSNGGDGVPAYGYGLYKLTALEADVAAPTNEYIYLDFRDDDYGYYGFIDPPVYGDDNDTWVRYNPENFYDVDSETNFAGKFLISSSDIPGTYREIKRGELVRIWKIKRMGMPSTDSFPNFWANSLGLASKDNHPWLVWSAYPNTNPSEYWIYRALSSFPVGNPIFLNFSKVATVNDTTFDYIDQDIHLNTNGQYLYYYVRSDISETKSNIVNTKGYIHKKNIHEDDDSRIYHYKLDDNFPNPFNPSTTISFSIPEDRQVNLKVYNILGEEIVELVNELKSRGNHYVMFNAIDLPSGLYYYAIQINDFSEVKKMILLK